MLQPYEYKATVERIVDGNTADLTVDLGFTVRMRVRVHLTGVDTPQIYGVKKASAEYKAGKAASEFVKALIPPGSSVMIRSHGMDEQRRWLADVLTEDGTDVGEALVAAGHAE